MSPSARRGRNATTATDPPIRYGVHPTDLHRRPQSRARSLLVWLLLVAGWLLTSVALVAVWANTLLLDAGAYVDAVGPLAHDPDVQDEITAVATDGIVDALNLGFAAGASHAVVERAVGAYVGSDAFPPMWRDANRAAHVQIVGLVTGEEGDILVPRDGQVWLELGPIAAAVADQLGAMGIAMLPVEAIADDIEFPLFATDDLEPVQTLFHRIERAAFWFPLAAVAAFLAAVMVTPRRLATIASIGIGLIGSGGLVLIVVAVAGRLYRARTSDSVPGVVADRLFERLTDPLRDSALALIVAATAVAIVAKATDLIRSRLRRIVR